MLWRNCCCCNFGRHGSPGHSRKSSAYRMMRLPLSFQASRAVECLSCLSGCPAGGTGWRCAQHRHGRSWLLRQSRPPASCWRKMWTPICGCLSWNLLAQTIRRRTLSITSFQRACILDTKKDTASLQDEIQWLYEHRKQAGPEALHVLYSWLLARVRCTRHA